MNAKNEFLSETHEKQVLCVSIEYGSDYWNAESQEKIELKVGFNTEEYELFLKRLDFEYNSGFGGQNLFGLIWYTDGTWSSRGEYDGSEWWEFHKCPTIFKDLI